MTQAMPVVEGVAINCDALLPTAMRISSDCNNELSFGVFTLNLDHVVKLRRNAEFRAAYRKARYVTADGYPIVWAGRLSGAKVQRVTGSDLVIPLCEAAASAGQPVFLFGSTFASLAGAARRLKDKIPKLEIAGVLAPEARFDPTSEVAAQYARQISASGAKICLIALGAPKQEIFTSLAVGQTTGVAFVCVGAGLDFLSGVQTRAPRWARHMGLEWLWRLLRDPARLGRRYLDCLVVLPILIFTSLSSKRASAQPNN
jgi:N-acetylglucosaminyldiphosphoundecaprenol N-acetyl-beta-D-mannosaminyltransferase